MDIEHDLNAHRFQARTPSGMAVLSYREKDSGALELYSTFVPEADREQGIAGRLVETAIRYAREQGRRVIPTCPYVARWLREHPEHAKSVV